MQSGTAHFGSIPLTHYSMSSLLRWGEEHSVDHPNIDAQHQAIFALAMEVHEHWRRNAGRAELRMLVDKLYNVLEGHFRYEERVLEALAYPELKQHAAEHQGMLDELKLIREQLSAGASRGSLPPGFRIFNFMLGVTVGHICNSDLEYCLYAAQHRPG